MTQTVQQQAEQVFLTVCQTLDNLECEYRKRPDDLWVSLPIRVGKDPGAVILSVDSKLAMLQLCIPLAHKMSPEKRVEGALAACAASFSLLDGNFDYDLEDGEYVFRMADRFIDCTMGEGHVRNMLSYACSVVDTYVGIFIAIDRGDISVDEFIKHGV